MADPRKLDVFADQPWVRSAALAATTRGRVGGPQHGLGGAHAAPSKAWLATRAAAATAVEAQLGGKYLTEASTKVFPQRLHPASQFLLGGESGPGIMTGGARGVTPGTAGHKTRIPRHIGYDGLVEGGVASGAAPLSKAHPQLILTEENFRGPGFNVRERYTAPLDALVTMPTSKPKPPAFLEVRYAEASIMPFERGHAFAPEAATVAGRPLQGVAGEGLPGGDVRPPGGGSAAAQPTHVVIVPASDDAGAAASLAGTLPGAAVLPGGRRGNLPLGVADTLLAAEAGDAHATPLPPAARRNLNNIHVMLQRAERFRRTLAREERRQQVVTAMYNPHGALGVDDPDNPDSQWEVYRAAAAQRAAKLQRAHSAAANRVAKMLPHVDGVARRGYDFLRHDAEAMAGCHPLGMPAPSAAPFVDPLAATGVAAGGDARFFSKSVTPAAVAAASDAGGLTTTLGATAGAGAGRGEPVHTRVRSASASAASISVRRGGAADLTSTAKAAADWYWVEGGSDASASGAGKRVDPVVTAGSTGTFNAYTGQMALSARPVHGADGGHSDADGFGGRGAAAPLLHAAATIRPHTSTSSGGGGGVTLGVEALRRTATAAAGATRGSASGVVPGANPDDGTWRALGYRSKGRVDTDLQSRRPATARVIDPSIDPDATGFKPRVRNLWSTNPDLARPREYDAITGRVNVLAATAAAVAPSAAATTQ